MTYQLFMKICPLMQKQLSKGLFIHKTQCAYIIVNFISKFIFCYMFELFIFLQVCGSRWKNQYYKKPRYYLQNGICYWLPNTQNPEATAQIMLPLIERSGYFQIISNSEIFFVIQATLLFFTLFESPKSISSVSKHFIQYGPSGLKTMF